MPVATEVTIELYGIARRRAGVAEARVAATTRGAALLALERGQPGVAGEGGREGRLVLPWRASLGGGRFVEDPSTPLEPGARVLVLSGIAGG